MKSLYFGFGLAAATAVVALACGAASAQTPTNGDRVHPTPSTAGTAADRASGQDSMAQGQVDRAATQTFVKQAAQSNLAEVEEAKYVMDHTKSQAVKDFAQRMVSDHTMALDQLKQIASTDGYKVPDSVDAKDNMAMEKLKHEKSARMNMTYSSDQEKDHREVISKFEQASRNHQIAPAVREYARAALPTLKEHLHLAQQLVASESNGNRKTG